MVTPRYLCVQRHVSNPDRQLLGRLSRGWPHGYGLRVLRDQVYALGERRCRPQTALDTGATRRRRLRRFPQGGAPLTKLCASTLEKALTFLADQLLPSPSHAGERGNRRERKRPKSVSRVRTHAQSRARLALERWREAPAEGRQHTLALLPRARAG